MARLCDPFIIQLVNTYQDEQRAYMLTGLLEGGELAQVLHNTADEYGTIGEDNAKFYAAGILEGLTFMHRRKIIHRDLKPQNVMINSKGYPVIIDLGFGESNRCSFAPLRGTRDGVILLYSKIASFLF